MIKDPDNNPQLQPDSHLNNDDAAQSKPADSKRPFLAVSAVVALLVVIILAAYAFQYNYKQSMSIDTLIAQRQYAELADIYINSRASSKNKLKIEDYFKQLLNTMFTQLGSEKLSESEAKEILSASSIIAGVRDSYIKADSDYKSVLKFRETENLAREKISGKDYYGACKLLATLPNSYVKISQKTSGLIESAKDSFYKNGVDQAGNLIKQSDYEGAAQIANQLSEFFPKDPRVQNLLFSTNNLELYSGEVEQICFQPLIAYTDRAFDKNNPNYKIEDNYMITVQEFKNILDQLYKENYILVDLSYLYSADFNGKKVSSVSPKELYLPKGKKPIVLSVDDMNYYPYMKESGQVSKLTLDSNGNVAALSQNAQGAEVISNDNEIVPILDLFVEKHPDFSFNNSKGTIALTGLNGVFGYNINDPGERQQAQAVINRLKETGWTFASHSQEHWQSSDISYSELKKDTGLWLREVEPLTGETGVYVYPLGEGLPYGRRFNYLLSKGFAVLSTTGMSSSLTFGENYVLQQRLAVNGMTIRSGAISPLLDPKKIVDPKRSWYNEVAQ